MNILSIRQLVEQTPIVHNTIKTPLKQNLSKFVSCDYYTWSNDKGDYVRKTGTFYFHEGQFHTVDLAGYDSTDWIVSIHDPVGILE